MEKQHIIAQHYGYAAYLVTVITLRKEDFDDISFSQQRTGPG